jgi:polyisoprenyl-teichoic acid--peptidoglycan teichoic acid transferase
VRVTRAQGRSFRRRYAVALGVVVALVIGSVVAINVLIEQKLSTVSRVNLQLASPPSGGANYLLIGSDTRAFVNNPADKNAFGSQAGNQGQRSDTMMILHAEPGAGHSLLVSIPRDLWVNIPGQGMAKINAAFNIGPQKVVDTISADFGVPIQHYVEVNFDTFRKLVDAVGTVPVSFPAPTRDALSGLNVAYPGCYHLDGPAALSFVRSRHMEVYDPATRSWKSVDAVPDIGRIGRQQTFLRQIASVALSHVLSNPFSANSLVDNVISELKLDNSFGRSDVFNLVDAFQNVNPNDPSHVQTTTLPWKTGPTVQGQDVLYLKQPGADQVLAQLRDFSGGSSSTGSSGASTPTIATSTVRVRVLNASGTAAVAARTLATLQSSGFASAGTGNDPRGRITSTEIRYRSSSAEAARLLATYVPSAQLVVDNTITGADTVLVLGRSFTGVTAPSRPATSATTPTNSTATPAATTPQPGSLAPVPGGC